MAEDELVSVVVPVFNGEAYLRESLESILAQSYPALEVIVVDDASSDASAQIAADLARADQRVTVRKQPSNVGQFANVNAGLSVARGEFVAVYHADDVYHPEIVAREVAFLQTRPEAAAVFTLAVLVDEAGHEFGRIDRLPPDIEAEELLRYPLVLNAILRYESLFLPTPSALVRRDVYTQLGDYSLAYGLRGDLEMWLRIARHRPLGLIRECLMRYRVGNHNESRRYAYLRTAPDLLYTVIDERLAAGDRKLVERDAMSAYEAHRAVDSLLAARNAYVVGQPSQARALLRNVRTSHVLAGRRPKRLKLLVLLGLMRLLGGIPHSAAIARLLRPRSQTGTAAPQAAHARPELTAR